MRLAHPSSLVVTTRRRGAPGSPTSLLDPGGSRCGVRNPGAQVPGTVGPPQVFRRSPALSWGPAPSPERRMLQPASARKGV
ncbi:hypothetical protein K503DRAFT_806764 [Rhizopogon vinicolor AM-OR11-026]|uniref:Uncharacterized protein n=1 Tax=Rhizopogon vinicolor AM-OR11-026 TaxID=1314800 RepID=A0A1B7MDS8_9AGAM|nr:hypothetical protein K503DRAFT_806764 [Rhizopogon vinicolor AM-OR11-026]